MDMSFRNPEACCIMTEYAGNDRTAVSAPFVYSGTELDAMAGARNYCRWILRYFEPYLGERVVEIGAGKGTFSEWILNALPTKKLILFEAAANLFPVLQQRFGREPRVCLEFGAFHSSVLKEFVDSIVLVNVLEHILDDTSLLLQAHQALRPGGSLLLFVPALQWNYGSLDAAFGHHRRYTKAAVRRKLEGAGFRVEHARYVNMLGIASWFLAGRILRQTTLSRSQVRWYDRWVIPWSFKVEQLCAPPIGQSLIAVALK